MGGGSFDGDARIMRLVLLGLAVSLTLVAPAVGQEPFARARLEPRGPVMVGQPVSLVVEVFVSTWFARAPEFPTLDIGNAITTPPGRSSNLNERAGGTQYFGIRRSYTIYPQVAGNYEVPAVTVTVLPGGADDRVTLRTRALSLEARIPAEAAGLDYFIGTTRLTVSQSLSPRADTFKVGDAISRSVTMTVYDALSLVLPPLAFDSIPGLALYAEPPVVTDEGGERGTRIVGRRVETVTYVMQEEGDYELPEVEIAWWDLGAGRLRRSSVPAVSFHVEPNPDYAAEFAIAAEADSVAVDTPPADSRLSRRAITLGLVALLTLAVLIWLARRHGPSFAGWLAEWRYLRQESEAAYFARFRAACRAADPGEAMRRLVSWLDRAHSGQPTPTVASFVAEANDPELAAAIADLEERLYGRGAALEGSWQGDRLDRAVRRHRKRRLAPVRARRAAGELAPLNPSGGGR